MGRPLSTHRIDYKCVRSLSEESEEEKITVEADVSI